MELVFGRDAILNIQFQANWQYIKERRQRMITQNNQRENAKRKPYIYKVGDKVMIEQYQHRKHGTPKYKGPYTVTKVNDNGTVRLRQRLAGRGAIFQTWNLRNIHPYKD
jgi:hypothetical protein